MTRLAQRLLRITCPLAIVLGSPSLAKAENPCLSFPGDPDAPTEILNAGLEMPVPNTGQIWYHAQGSTAHRHRDKNSLDLNENLTTWDFDDGLPALAAASGLVTFAGWTTCGYGYSVVVEHNNGSETFSTHYAHLHEDLMVTEGQWVLQGQVLGYISRSGTDNEHLHFTVFQGTAARYADVNGQSTENANTQNLFLDSDTQVVWFEDFMATPHWEQLAGSIPLFMWGHAAYMPPDLKMHHEQPVFALPDRPYRLSFAALSFRLRRAVPKAWLRLDCLDKQENGTKLDTIWLTAESEWLGGWAVRSFRVGDGGHPCPEGTRFVRPVLEAQGDSDTAMLIDWVALEEAPAVTDGGMARFHSYIRGAIRHHAWSVDEPEVFSMAHVVGASTRAGAGLHVVCSEPVGEANGSCTSQSVEHRYYFLVLITTEGVPWYLGPIGPVESYRWALVPGLGDAKIVSSFKNVPDWADYPYESFDGDTTNYGLINYAPTAEWVLFAPSIPVVGVTSFEAHYGGTIHTAYVYVQDYVSKDWIYVGQNTNTPLEWSVVSAPDVWPDLTGGVFVLFDRQDLDQFIHVAEVAFR